MMLHLIIIKLEVIENYENRELILSRYSHNQEI